MFIDVVLDPAIKHGDSPARLVIGIPTRNRPEKLLSALISISELKYTPEMVFVCDSSESAQHERVKKICDDSDMPVILIRSERASIPYQRNQIVDFALKSEDQFGFLLFLDDDTKPDYLYSQLLLEAFTNCRSVWHPISC